MAARDPRLARARADARDLRSMIARELREGRLNAGLSQRTAGAAAAMSHAQFGRIERGELADLSLDQAARAAQAVGLRLTARLLPLGDPVRDAAQLALLERFRRRLPPATGWSTEVPMPIPGDLRAWDGVATLRGRRAGCEAETRLRDMQALERRLARKLRDGDVHVILLIVAGTAANRDVLRAHREALRALLPLDSREVLGALASGQLPDASGLVIL
jgi:transcriptional regulator with XRE-family HTH domain